MSAKLVSKDKRPPSTKNKGLAGLRFNYTGIKEATTNSGCTVQTDTGSMQNSGAVRLLMDTEQKGTDKMLGSIKYATAYGNVAVAGKDKSGRLLRATGDKLTVDAKTGKKILSGKEVFLEDLHNTHKASGKGAAIIIDADNNATITGEEHTSYATEIRKQLNEQKKQK
jgi:lipopolysaccharide export system protein LptA